MSIDLAISYFPGCPHQEPAGERPDRAIEEAGLVAGPGPPPGTSALRSVGISPPSSPRDSRWITATSSSCASPSASSIAFVDSELKSPL